MAKKGKISRKPAFIKTKYPPLAQSAHAKRAMHKIGVQPYIEGEDVEMARHTLKGMRMPQQKKARKRR